MKNIIFSSNVSEDYFDEMKEILFFNDHQSLFKNSIEKSIDTFGLPEIFVYENKIKVKVGNLTGPQLLCAFLDENPLKLLGVGIFYRDCKDTITLLQISVKESVIFNDRPLGLLIIYGLKKIAKTIKGVKYLRYFYGIDDIKIKIK